MRLALSAEKVMPNEIKDTSWGHIFIAYMPITDGNEVVGVLGVEFDAGHQFETYRILIIAMPILIIFFCIIVYIVAFKLFRRISNPHYQDLANTDRLTGVKNRNAFDIDISNINHKGQFKGALMSIDLDNLKIINDTKGHLEGDKYIISCLEIIKFALTPESILYRIGGDEFAIIAYNFDLKMTEELVSKIEIQLNRENRVHNDSLSLTIGHAEYMADKDLDLMETFKRADYHMYNLKRNKRTKI